MEFIPALSLQSNQHCSPISGRPRKTGKCTIIWCGTASYTEICSTESLCQHLSSTSRQTSLKIIHKDYLCHSGIHTCQWVECMIMWQILHEQLVLLYLYHLHCMHDLHPHDFSSYPELCQRFLSQCCDDPSFNSPILFTWWSRFHTKQNTKFTEYAYLKWYKTVPQEETDKERLWEERPDWRLAVHSPTWTRNNARRRKRNKRMRRKEWVFQLFSLSFLTGITLEHSLFCLPSEQRFWGTQNSVHAAPFQHFSAADGSHPLALDSVESAWLNHVLLHSAVHLNVGCDILILPTVLLFGSVLHLVKDRLLKLKTMTSVCTEYEYIKTKCMHPH